MNDINNKFIDYQGNKAELVDFIQSGISEYLDENDVVLDIFAGSGSVSAGLQNKYTIYSNDAEAYSAAINSALLCSNGIPLREIKDIKTQILQTKSNLINQEKLNETITKEIKYIQNKDLNNILQLYSEHDTVWDSKYLTPSKLRKLNKFNLFIRYYGGSYFGIEQSVEIDAIIKTIKKQSQNKQDLMYSSLFYAMNKTVFSRDGHMAQPLNFEKNATRGFKHRERSLVKYFIAKLKEQSNRKINNKNHKVFNNSFEKILTNKDIMNNVDLIYVDPPYTDMQYSRYYHLLNVAKLYAYPELTITSRGYTVGLYTEGRFQSDLSKKSKAKSDLIFLITEAHKNNVAIALSYAYPEDELNQATNRYTISIDELVEITKSIYTPDQVQVKQIKYNHTNHRNTRQKPVIEYLILCGERKNTEEPYSISHVKSVLKALKPTNRNPIYNTHLYWSQKSFNVIDTLIENFTDVGDTVFDPFMGSGVTVFEAIKKNMNRKAIGVDLNEMPIFISKTLLEYSFKDNLEIELLDFIHKISPLLSYYEVKCPKCGWGATIERVVFDKPERTSTNIDIKTVNIDCPGCGRVVLEDNIQHFVNEMYHNYNYNYVDSEFTYLPNSKIAVVENEKITNIYTSRNLKVLDEIITASKTLSKEAEEIIKYVLMSFLHQTKITDARSNSQWPLWTPKKNGVERNVIMLFETRMNRFIKALKTIKSTYSPNSLVNNFNKLENGKAYLIQKPSQHIKDYEVPDNSVDLIITDPPYLDQVLYSEYMQLYSPILNFNFNLEDEIVVSPGEDRDKDRNNYYELLFNVFNMSKNKLKINKLMALYFHDSNLDVWHKLIKNLYNLGFDYKGQVHIQKNNTLKNIISPKNSLKGDLILFFNNTKQSRVYKDGQESIDEIEFNIIKEAKHMITTNGPMTTTQLYDDGLMEVLIVNGWLNKLSQKYRTLVHLFEKHFYWNPDQAVWHLEQE